MNRNLYEGKSIRAASYTLSMVKKLDVNLIKDKCILDIGCNEGLISIFLKERGAKSVIGFEPQPQAFKIALKNAKKYGFTVEQRAVTDKDSRITLRTNKIDSENNYYCNANICENKNDDRYIYHDIESKSFKSILSKHKPYGIKMDVEGAEFEMLLNNRIPKYVKWIIVEIHWLKKTGAFLFPFLCKSMEQSGLGIYKWPSELSIKNNYPNSFKSSSDMIFMRGHETSDRHRETYEKIIEIGMNNKPKTIIANRQKMIGEYYGI